MAKVVMVARLGGSLRSVYERRGTKRNGISSILFCTARAARHLVFAKQTDVSTVEVLMANSSSLAIAETFMADEEK